MAAFYSHDNADADTSAIVWKQHFGLSGDNVEEEEWDEVMSNAAKTLQYAVKPTYPHID